MYKRLFQALIQYVVPPTIAVVTLSATPLGQDGALVLVAILLTACTIPWTLWLGLRILPNLLLIRAKKATYLVVEIVVAICTLIGFWLIYILNR